MSLTHFWTRFRKSYNCPIETARCLSLGKKPRNWSSFIKCYKNWSNAVKNQTFWRRSSFPTISWNSTNQCLKLRYLKTFRTKSSTKNQKSGRKSDHSIGKFKNLSTSFHSMLMVTSKDWPIIMEKGRNQKKSTATLLLENRSARRKESREWFKESNRPWKVTNMWFSFRKPIITNSGKQSSMNSRNSKLKKLSLTATISSLKISPKSTMTNGCRNNLEPL